MKHINPLKTKRSQLYLKTQFVPRSEDLQGNFDRLKDYKLHKKGCFIELAE